MDDRIVDGLTKNVLDGHLTGERKTDDQRARLMDAKDDLHDHSTDGRNVDDLTKNVLDGHLTDDWKTDDQRARLMDVKDDLKMNVSSMDGSKTVVKLSGHLLMDVVLADGNLNYLLT